MGRYVGAAVLGAAVASLIFLVVLSVAELHVTDKNSENGTATGLSPTNRKNLVRNPSAEVYVGNWGKTSGASSLATVGSSEPGVDGSRVFRLTRTGAGTGSVSAFSPYVPVRAGEILTASASLVAIPGRRSGIVGIDFKANDGTFLGPAPDSAAVTSDGSRVTTRGIAPAGAALATVVVSLINARQEDALDFDAVKAEKKALAG